MSILSNVDLTDRQQSLAFLDEIEEDARKAVNYDVNLDNYHERHRWMAVFKLLIYIARAVTVKSARE